MFETMGSPIQLGTVTLKNRIIFAPTTFGMRLEELQEEIRRIAQGGCAMIILGDVPVLKSRFGWSLDTTKGFSYYRSLVEIAHQEGCLIAAQLHQSDTSFKEVLRFIPDLMMKKMDPKDLRKKINDAAGPYITALPTAKVEKITHAFAKAAVLAERAGFDMIQVHGDRMCGSFSSSLLNRREDRYGGSVRNRARFAVEAVSAIRQQLPKMPIDYKLAVRQENPNYGRAGVLEEELSVFVPLLEQAGVTSFHVTLANHGALEDTIPPANHPYFHEEGCFLKYCDQVRKRTALPICGVGGLSHPAFVEEQLVSGRIDCAAMSRQLIADPMWVRKALSNQPETIHTCIRCNQRCLRGLQEHRGVHCIYEGGKEK